MIILLLLLFVICSLLILNYNIFNDDTVTQRYNGITYKVRKSDKNTQLNTAKKLEYFRNELEKVVDYCKNNNIPTQEDADRMFKRFKLTKFNETPTKDSSAAYVVNKGQELRVCLKGEDDNDVMFVLLHELAHIMSKSYGHNEEFKKNMDFLVKLAAELGIYKPVDYSKTPINYCGTKITNTPCANKQCYFGTKL